MGRKLTVILFFYWVLTSNDDLFIHWTCTHVFVTDPDIGTDNGGANNSILNSG